MDSKNVIDNMMYRLIQEKLNSFKKSLGNIPHGQNNYLSFLPGFIRIKQKPNYFNLSLSFSNKKALKNRIFLWIQIYFCTFKSKAYVCRYLSVISNAYQANKKRKENQFYIVVSRPNYKFSYSLSFLWHNFYTSNLITDF